MNLASEAIDIIVSMKPLDEVGLLFLEGSFPHNWGILVSGLGILMWDETISQPDLPSQD